MLALLVIARDIGRLLSCELVGLNRYNLLILGRKRIGKTTILEQMRQACKTVVGDHVAVVSIELNRDEDALKHGLYLFLAKQIGCPMKSQIWGQGGTLSGRIDNLLEHVRVSKRPVVIFIAELQHVHTKDFKFEES